MNIYIRNKVYMNTAADELGRDIVYGKASEPS